jgi:hypothetical protein
MVLIVSFITKVPTHLNSQEIPSLCENLHLCSHEPTTGPHPGQAEFAMQPYTLFL